MGELIFIPNVDQSRVQKSQERIEINPETSILFPWAVQAALHASSRILHENIHATREQGQ